MSSAPVRNCALVIDDDPCLREMIMITGETLGVRVLEAEDCRAGLRVLKEHLAVIKLILLDYFMPGMTPVACANCLKELAGDEISIVLITAAVNPAERAAELCLNRWLSKPFDFTSLKNVLRECALHKEPR